MLKYISFDDGKPSDASTARWKSGLLRCRIAAIVLALSALAQTTRLETFQLLVKHEPDGVASDEIARMVEVPENTMLTHLATLARAGLVKSERHSRTIVYRADLDGLRATTLFLLKDCCGGKADLCAPLIADLTPCCAPELHQS